MHNKYLGIFLSDLENVVTEDTGKAVTKENWGWFGNQPV
jgi:hypothetical protein